ncbi:haloacid dehalogenase-like hydrolase [Rhizobium leguminosarum]|uniref:HAD family hydrolase n=2 Tax=Rhizobium leguminosarum TaxID=384 RepID=UPI001C963CCC|nr:HAD family hydrolase [Rhizobium leguminosarum]MBY5591899.1 haloacid dehalogenase-like hydrolase [Rhizobium leguminosarum]
MKMLLSSRQILAAAALAVLVFVGYPAYGQDDPLPSWNDTPTKKAILNFVGSVTKEGGPDFVAMQERVAVFDMDGTLVPQKPVPIALVPVMAEIRDAVARKPFLGDKPAVAALLKRDEDALHAAGQQGVLDLIAVATDGKTTDEIAQNVQPLLEKENHPKFDVPYAKTVYQGMRELLALLEANGFSNWISSGSPVLVTRELSMEMFDIPPERLIGSNAGTKFDERDGRSVLVFDGTINAINDGAGKPVGINLAIGKRLLVIGGNEGGRGDVAMMRWSKDRNGPSLQLLINHDDAAREYAYAESDGYSLDAARKYGFQVVSMKDDWKTIIGK